MHLSNLYLQEPQVVLAATHEETLAIVSGTPAPAARVPTIIFHGEDDGTVSVYGVDIDQDFELAKTYLGVVPQELVFDPFFTVRETLTIQSGYFGLRNNGAWIDELLHCLDLTDKADTNMRQLSGGMKRRVLIGQALVHKPPVIVLDEPTAGVDVELRQSLWQFIRRLNRDGHTIVLTTHYLEEAEALCGRIAMLKRGEIVASGSAAEVARAPRSLTGKYQTSADAGLLAKGITITSRAGAQVVAPFDGIVAFAGPFRGYGQLLIVEHSEGYHTLLAGLGRIDIAAGQRILAGEPVGIMNSSLKRMDVPCHSPPSSGVPPSPMVTACLTSTAMALA